MQLDIFEHSREVMLRNDAVHALEQRDASAALQAYQPLSREYPADASLPALRVLSGYIEQAEVDRHDVLRDHEALREARQLLHETS
ncbi:hypothetical protein C7T35_08995 [Variovorax sp. WS11]|uniref:hypothetical protein n=1 Tax=Variovorax sp. WS11 TaxID=1105204 RepID=UPI000D0CC2D3|nr:hypothetical protein [Variovorax sp. WS11]NDZ17898.1 hypothetical protein [Variovorax sp. WS11]PSL85015.1 hypothetical protein C7T35_08995 [Variovorax sp. WS11]